MRRRPAPSCSLTSGAGAVPIQPKGIVARHSVLAAATRGCAVASAHLRPARLPHTAGLAASEPRTFSAQQAIGYRAVAVGFLGQPSAHRTLQRQLAAVAQPAVIWMCAVFAAGVPNRAAHFPEIRVTSRMPRASNQISASLILYL